MKDFDAERSSPVSEEERAFTIAGQRFVIRPASPPEVWVRYWDERALQYRSVAATAAHLDLLLEALEEKPPPSLKDIAENVQLIKDGITYSRTGTNEEYVAVLDRTMCDLIEPDQGDLWTQVREHADPPITLGQISDILTFALEVQTSRPTQQANSSTSGPATNGTISTEKQPEPVSTSPA